MNRRTFLAMGVGAAAAPWRTRDACGGFELRFGVTQFDRFDPIAEVDRLGRGGFDYCEPSVARMMALGDADFEAARRQAAGGRVHVEAMNSFIPADLKIVGPDVDRQRLEAYVSAALQRAERLQAKIVVFGSGGARRVPDGFPHADAWRQLREFLRAAGSEIERRNYGMVIGIEALRKAESNIVNTSADAYRLAQETSHRKVRTIVDFFHLFVEGESPAVLRRIKDGLVHLHFSNPVQGRSFPRDVSECPGYAPFFANLREIGYRGRMSLEASSMDAELDVPRSLGVIRQLYSGTCDSRQLGIRNLEFGMRDHNRSMTTNSKF